MDKYVLHSNFYTIDMYDLDVVLGYPWMDSIGIVNINLQKKFLKLWYKKKKITLQDISLFKQENVSTRKLVVAPADTSEEDSMVESEEETIKEHEEIPQEEHGNEEDHIEEHEEMPQEEHQNEEEFIEFPSLKEP